LQQKQLESLGNKWREAVKNVEDLARWKYVLENGFRAMEKQYCDKLEGIHSLAFAACRAAGMQIESTPLPKVDDKEYFFPQCPITSTKLRAAPASQASQSHGDPETMLQRARDNIALYGPNLRLI